LARPLLAGGYGPLSPCTDRAAEAAQLVGLFDGEKATAGAAIVGGGQHRGGADLGRPVATVDRPGLRGAQGALILDVGAVGRLDPGVGNWAGDREGGIGDRGAAALQKVDRRVARVAADG